ncbi:basic proline-rich protein-like [Cavia porcellus]|uniref:basic proline-rich protein-like n=1 Tax=Cavia porcellus TaxID=10141 RepID=UPI002FE39397
MQETPAGQQDGCPAASVSRSVQWDTCPIRTTPGGPCPQPHSPLRLLPGFFRGVTARTPLPLPGAAGPPLPERLPQLCGLSNPGAAARARPWLEPAWMPGAERGGPKCGLMHNTSRAPRGGAAAPGRRPLPCPSRSPNPPPPLPSPAPPPRRLETLVTARSQVDRPSWGARDTPPLSRTRLQAKCAGSWGDAGTAGVRPARPPPPSPGRAPPPLEPTLPRAAAGGSSGRGSADRAGPAAPQARSGHSPRTGVARGGQPWGRGDAEESAAGVMARPALPGRRAHAGPRPASGGGTYGGPAPGPPSEAPPSSPPFPRPARRPCARRPPTGCCRGRSGPAALCSSSARHLRPLVGIPQPCGYSWEH